MGQQALGIALDPEGYIKAERQAPALQCRRLDCMQRLGGVQGDVHLVRLQGCSFRGMEEDSVVEGGPVRNGGFSRMG